jgi:transcriptional regulator with XRE-family HTH domain
MPKPVERPLPLRATLFDVAKMVGVSIQTVSAVINDKPGISAATRDRVRQAANELDYEPTSRQQPPRPQKSEFGRAGLEHYEHVFPEFIWRRRRGPRERLFAVSLQFR